MNEYDVPVVTRLPASASSIGADNERPFRRVQAIAAPVTRARLYDPYAIAQAAEV
ncbi:hypothetical protein AB0K60_01380 [Thermopolyspora sp. NPDC052614]|uniref:hypothetical protein n=1 Tax=Thermopolyspora sp. NPDC052614 TaxID=3155682 RepID=UPI0034322CE0